jgi:hypothetical protein
MRTVPSPGLVEGERSSNARITGDDARLAKRWPRHPDFRGHIGSFTFSERSGALVVRGEVPSFYLKQLVLCVLQKLDNLERIENCIAVVSSTGLSSPR